MPPCGHRPQRIGDETVSTADDMSTDDAIKPPHALTADADAPLELAAAKSQIQRRFGRCLLLLQQCEQVFKLLVAHRTLAGPVESLPAIQQARVEQTAKRTLGSTAGDLLNSVVVPAGAPGTETAIPEDCLSFGFSMRLELPPDEYVRVEADTRALVALRNDLAHHFVSRHNFSTPEGYRIAGDALADAEARIEAYWTRVTSWAEWFDQARIAAASFFTSGEFHEWIANGVAPDGTVDWPSAGCVRVLREAAEALAEGGWTPLDAAERWMAKRHPEQTPAKYGCRGWRQVLSESRVFELRYRPGAGGNRRPWFRPRNP